MIIVAVCTAALIIVLSVFNGLRDLIGSLYSSFDPQIKVQYVKGKSFELTDDLLQEIKATEGVAIMTEVIEDYAYIRYRKAEMVAIIKGVSENFLDQGRFEPHTIIRGELKLKESNVNYAIIGQGIYYALSISPNNDLYPLQVHYIKDIKSGSLNVNRLYSKKNILPGSVFAIEKNYDENYVFVPLDFAKELLDYGNKRTSLEIKVQEGYNIDEVRDQLKIVLGNDFKVQNNQEQHADIYKLLKLEKLFVFVAFSFILAVGSINIFFSLTMLAIDKKKDIAILYSMGASNGLIKKIFLGEGAIISLGGAALGLLIGSFVCWLQQNYGLVSMGMETSVLENYPVQMQLTDFFFTAASLIIITFIIAYRPAVIATRYNRARYL